MSTIGVIGGGTMGAGIAQVAVMAGETVHVLDVDRATAEQAVEGIGKRLARLVEKGRLESGQAHAHKARLQACDDVAALESCDLVVEAIVENLDVKVALFEKIVGVVAPEAWLATNTSSLSITTLGERTGSGPRLCGMHFFNPAPLMPLVEVVAGNDTTPACIDEVFDYATRWGKTAVRVKDTPGFIVNRVARPYYLEALRLASEGWATCLEIDALMKSAGGFRMGPFELMDLVGIDVNYAVSCSVYEQSGRPARFHPSPIQADLVQAGHLGRKTGTGIYRYDSDPPGIAFNVTLQDRAPSQALHDAWIALQPATGIELQPREGYMFARILCALMNEAALAAQEQVASVEDIDLAMQRGTNYPRGLLTWASDWGPARVGAFLRALNDSVEDQRFAPALRYQG